MILSNLTRGQPRNGIETTSLSWDDVTSRFRQLFFSGADVDMGGRAAEKLSPVAAAHRILTNSFGLIPFGVYRKNGEAREPVQDDALNEVLKVRPNPMMTPYLMRKIVMSNAFWWGVGRVWNQRDDLGRIVARIPLPTECCTIQKDRETGSYWYEYNVDGVVKRFASYELSQLFFESYDGIRGRGFMDLSRESVATDALAQRYNRKFYANGARISGVLEIDTDASPETREKVKGEFKGFAADEAFAVAVLDHGMKYTPLGISQADAQYIESRQFAVEEVSRFTGIPKYMLQVGKEAYNSNAQQRIDYVTDTLLPYVTQWEEEDSYKLILPGRRRDGWYVKGNVAVLLRADPKTRGDFYAQQIEHAILCPDEARAMEERNPIPGGAGKQFLATKNLGSLESVLRGDGDNG